MSELTACYAITVYVPEDDVESFREKVSPSIPQIFGNYDHVCWTSSIGTGQFRPLEGANPTLGGVGNVSQEPERRFECLIPKDEALLEKFIAFGIKPAHPYEAPVILVQEARLYKDGD